MLFAAVVLALCSVLLAFFGFGVIAANSWDDDEPLVPDDEGG